MNEECQALVEQFTEWRKTKPEKRSPIPNDFWEQIKIFHHKYPEVNLKSILSINSASWNRKVLDRFTANKSKTSKLSSPASDFVQIKSFKGKKDFLKIKLPNNTEITFFE